MGKFIEQILIISIRIKCIGNYDDIDEAELYPMRYDEVLAYADADSASFTSFRLLVQILYNPVKNQLTKTARNA